LVYGSAKSVSLCRGQFAHVRVKVVIPSIPVLLWPLSHACVNPGVPFPCRAADQEWMRFCGDWKSWVVLCHSLIVG